MYKLLNLKNTFKNEQIGVLLFVSYDFTRTKHI